MTVRQASYLSMSGIPIKIMRKSDLALNTSTHNTSLMKLPAIPVPPQYTKFSGSVIKLLGCNCFALSLSSCQHPCSKACCFVTWLCLHDTFTCLLVTEMVQGVLRCACHPAAQLNRTMLRVPLRAEVLLLSAEKYRVGHCQ